MTTLLLNVALPAVVLSVLLRGLFCLAYNRNQDEL